MTKDKTKGKQVGQICSQEDRKCRPDDGAGHQQPATVILYGWTGFVSGDYPFLEEL